VNLRRVGHRGTFERLLEMCDGIARTAGPEQQGAAGDTRRRIAWIEAHGRFSVAERTAVLACAPRACSSTR
jgi:hypothetical protein